MLGGLKEMAAGTVEKEMKKGLDPSFYKYFLLYKGDVAPYRQSLGMAQKEFPYFSCWTKPARLCIAPPVISPMINLKKWTRQLESKSMCGLVDVLMKE